MKAGSCSSRRFDACGLREQRRRCCPTAIAGTAFQRFLPRSFLPAAAGWALYGGFHRKNITGPRGSASEQQETKGFKAALQRFPKLGAIYATEDAMGSAVIRALKEKGYKPCQVKVVAQGGSRGTIADCK